MPHLGKSSPVGIDLNATRIRALAGAPPQPVLLDGQNEELPLALSLEHRHIEIGAAGPALCRRLPHLACLDFLGFLGTDRQWTAGRHRIDAVRALSLVFDDLRALLTGYSGVALTVPAYLDQVQQEVITSTAKRAKLPILGRVPTPLAVALVAHAEQPWSGAALVADLDDHALSWSVIQIDGSHARLIAAQAWPILGMRVWRERLLDALADRCVRQSRRDPRDSGDAEQSLYEQIEPILDICRHGQMAEAAVQTTQWYQNLIVQPGELASACVSLIRQTVDAMTAVQAATLPPGGAGAVLLTDAVARLPGLLAAVESIVSPPSSPVSPESDDDFGAGLLDAMHSDRASLYLPAVDAPARAALALAERWQRRELPPGRLDYVPLLPPLPADSGLPRLHFRGQEFVLSAPTFTLGRHPDCDLVFDSDLYPTVSARHCEIVQDRLGYQLRDRSRHGTLLNERPLTTVTLLHPGDTIRLGPKGPLLRFLGQSPDQRRLTSTA
jgi:hypothetical protein